MHVRRIYRWENQKESTAYLLAFMFLWAYGALGAVAVGVNNVTGLLPLTLDGGKCLALIAQVLRRRFEKPSVEKLRQDLARVEDSMTTAYTLSEQVEKRGAQSWVEPLIEDMGEWLLLQLGDMANLLEVMLKQVTHTPRHHVCIS